jgi:hypothetical protein
MRGPTLRTRSRTLALVLVCVGALSYDMPPAPTGSAGEVAVVLQVATTSLALPAPSWTAAVENTSGSSPDKERRHLKAPDSARTGPTGRAIHRPAAVAPPSSSGSALLGLPFAPANAPPLA